MKVKLFELINVPPVKQLDWWHQDLNLDNIIVDYFVYCQYLNEWDAIISMNKTQLPWKYYSKCLLNRGFYKVFKKTIRAWHVHSTHRLAQSFRLFWSNRHSLSRVSHLCSSPLDKNQVDVNNMLSIFVSLRLRSFK